jgi:hypothetical protein
MKVEGLLKENRFQEERYSRQIRVVNFWGDPEATSTPLAKLPQREPDFVASNSPVACAYHCDMFPKK